jgi:hypothetical protein
MLLACGGAWGMKKVSKTDVGFKFDLQPEEEDKVSPNALINSMPPAPITKVRFVDSLVKTFKKAQEFVSDMQSFHDILRKSKELKKINNGFCFVECINKDERKEKEDNASLFPGCEDKPFVEPEQRIEKEIKKIENIKNNETIKIKDCNTTITQLQEERKVLEQEKSVDYGKEIRNSAAFTVTMFAVSLGLLFKSGWQLPRSICLTASILSGVTGLTFLGYYIKKQGPYYNLVVKPRKKIDENLKNEQCKIKVINNETKKQLSQHLSIDDLKTLQDILSKNKREEFNAFWTNSNQSFIPTDETRLVSLCKKLAGEDPNFLCHMCVLGNYLYRYIWHRIDCMCYEDPKSWFYTVTKEENNNIQTAIGRYARLFYEEYKKLNPSFKKSFKYDDKPLPKLSQEDQEILKPLKSLTGWWKL